MSNDSHRAYLDHLVEETIKKSGTTVDPMIFDKDSPYSNTPDKKNLVNPMIFDVPTKSTEDKLYILFIVGENNDSMFDGNYKICNGRTECYRHIQSLIEAFGEDIDVHQSMVITETKQTETDTGNTKYYLINYTDAISVYAFCKSVESFYSNDIFSIDNYFEPPKEIDPVKSTFEDTSAPYSTMDDPIMAKIVSESIMERNDKIKQMLNFPNTVKHEAVRASGSVYTNNARAEFPMLFEEDEGKNV